MLDTGTRNATAVILERESRVRKAQRAERLLGFVLWIGFAMTVLFFSRV